jgi:hypothetical protein
VAGPSSNHCQCEVPQRGVQCAEVLVRLLRIAETGTVRLFGHSLRLASTACFRSTPFSASFWFLFLKYPNALSFRIIPFQDMLRIASDACMCVYLVPWYLLIDPCLRQLFPYCRVTPETFGQVLHSLGCHLVVDHTESGRAVEQNT